MAAIDSALGFKEYSVATGASTEQLQRWQHAAAHAGISGDVVAQSLDAISQGLVGLKKYGEHSPLANLLNPLHMSLQKYKDSSPEEVLHDIRENKWFQNMDAATQKFNLAKAGFAGMLGVLTKRGPYAISNANFSEFAKEGGVMTDIQIKKWVQIESLLISVEELSTRIGRDIANWVSGPIMTGLKLEVDSLMKIADYMDNISSSKIFIKDFGKILSIVQQNIKIIQQIVPYST